MKKTLVVVFCLLLVYMTLSVTLLPADVNSIEEENRSMQQAPKLSLSNWLNGTLTADIEKFISDKVYNRGNLLDIAKNIESLKGVESEYGSVTTRADDLGTGTSQKSSMIIAPDRVMETYYIDNQARDKYVNMLNMYAERVPSNVNMISMIVPTQIEFSEDMYRNSCDSQKDTIEYIYSNMDDRIKAVDVYSEIKQHTDEYIYFKTDHHWTARGAYYGYKAMQGELAYPLEDFQVHTVDGFTGWLYSQAGRPELSNGIDSIEYFTLNNIYKVKCSDMIDGVFTPYESNTINEPQPGVTPTYSIFMGGDAPFSVVNTNCNNGNTLLVMKDSYGNAIMPYLVNHYETIVIVDPRNCYRGMQSIFDEYNIDDFLILDYVLATNFSDFTDCMVNLWNK